VILTRRGISLSLSTILRCRPQLGWTFCGSAYCQVIHEANKAKRLEWARKNLDNDFGDVVFTDECSIQTETHRRFSSRKRGEPPEEQAQVYMLRRFTNMYKPPVFNIVFCQLVIACTCFFFTFRPKHPVKVHVWAGISMRGRTGIFIFSGIMDATMYTDILETTLLPFLHDTYPDGHKFMQDNDHQIWPREPTAVQLLQKTFV
jgi:hypothetical protein